MPRISTLKIEIRVLDTDLKARWTTGPTPSNEANAALHAAEEAASAAVRATGLTIVGVGYGATAKDYS